MKWMQRILRVKWDKSCPPERMVGGLQTELILHHGNESIVWHYSYRRMNRCLLTPNMKSKIDKARTPSKYNMVN